MATKSPGCPTDEVERVLQVVRSGGDVDVRRTQGRNGGQPSRRADSVAPRLEIEVRLRQCNDADPGFGDEFGGCTLL